MRIWAVSLVTVAVLGLGACTRESTGREDSAAHKAGRAAYEASERAKAAAEKAARELREASREAREGWNEAKREDKRDGKPVQKAPEKTPPPPANRK